MESCAARSATGVPASPARYHKASYFSGAGIKFKGAGSKGSKAPPSTPKKRKPTVTTVDMTGHSGDEPVFVEEDNIKKKGPPRTPKRGKGQFAEHRTSVFVAKAKDRKTSYTADRTHLGMFTLGHYAGTYTAYYADCDERRKPLVAEARGDYRNATYTWC